MSDKMVPLAEAENEVKVVTQRLALLHLAFSRTIVDTLGWDAGKQLILDSIKQYGEYVAERTKQGHQGLPKYGFWENREDKPPLCELGKIMLEYGEPELGAMYCLIDPAKIMATDPTKKMIHTRCMILGHDECQFDTIPTSEDERASFAKGKDWAFVDPVVDEFLKEP
ncbi:MAG: L-2-amino-thiazoline-4-carboxylic acid hydrolase [Candidatus Bathyarchaeota archaeon]|nr:L-2-amino-thiazoline-4-carboxylic acid hydrolase [Candidatus Bathyarchaeota archaeon]